MSMIVREPKYEKAEIVRRGEELYERAIRSQVESGNKGKFLVIDIDSGDFELDAEELSASDRLLARRPEAQMWLKRIGFPHACRFGPRGRKAVP